MELVFIFLVVIWAIILIGVSSMESSNNTPPKPREKKCPPHSWTYDPEGRMYCSECKMRPRFDSR